MKPTTKSLHVYRIDDGGEVFWYIAPSRRSALNQFFFDHASYPLLDKYHAKKMRKSAVIAQSRADWEVMPDVEQMDDKKKMTIRWYDAPDENPCLTKTCVGWIKEQKRQQGQGYEQGLLCQRVGDFMNKNMTKSAFALNISVDDDKYIVRQQHDGKLYALRYGEPWRDLTGDNLVCALAHEVERLRMFIDAIERANTTIKSLVEHALQSGHYPNQD